MMNVFAVNGIGGIMGSLLLAVFASEKMGGVGYAEGAGMASQLWIQIKAIAIIAVWSAVATLIIGYMVSMILPMRVSEAEENEGLDSASHGERAWEFD
jgi:ammonium transporter, Amt family